MRSKRLQLCESTLRSFAMHCDLLFAHSGLHVDGASARAMCLWDTSARTPSLAPAPRGRRPLPRKFCAGSWTCTAACTVPHPSPSQRLICSRERMSQPLRRRWADMRGRRLMRMKSCSLGRKKRLRSQRSAFSAIRHPCTARTTDSQSTSWMDG